MTDNSDAGASLRLRYAGEGGPQAVFTDRVADYAAARPDYPLALFETLKTICAPTAGVTVADIGAGTGLLTQGLLDHGYNVVAVEPNPGMRQAADHLLGRRNGYRSVAGNAESIPLETASVQLITAAQAFHWFDPERARAEFLRVLAPAGQVALIWNDRILDEPVNAALDEVSLEYGGEKRAALVACENRQYVPRFFGIAEPRQFSWPHQQSLTVERFLSLIFSRSYIPTRNTPDGLKVAERIHELFHRFARNGVVTIPYHTVAIIGRPA